MRLYSKLSIGKIYLLNNNSPFVNLNSLSQAIDINFIGFISYVIEHDQKLPAAIITKLLQHEHIGLIKEILEKQIKVYDIEDTSNLFGKTSTSNLFFQRLDQVSDSVKVKEKNKVILPKHIIYYLYKSTQISKEKKNYIIKELAHIMHINNNEILSSIIKLKDQDLAEYIYIFTY